MNKTRFYLTSALILLLLASTSIIALSARSHESADAANASHGTLKFTQLQSRNFSGDDVYDLAASRNLDLSALNDNGNYSGDDVYDLGAIRIRRAPVFWSSRNFSGDDVYDPATIRGFDMSTLEDNGNYSGDDIYDLAAGG